MQTQSFNIALPKDLVRKADLAAKKEYKNRSELIREALRIYLKDEEEWDELFSYAQKQGQKMGIKSEKDVERLVSKYRHGK